MRDLTPSPTGDDVPREGAIDEPADNRTSTTRPSTSRPPVSRSPHETDIRSKRRHPTRSHQGLDEEIWAFDEEMQPDLLKPQERWLKEFEQTKRRDRHNLIVLLTLVGYLAACGSVAAWLLVSGVDQQTVNMLLQVFVVSLIPVIVLIARGFHR